MVFSGAHRAYGNKGNILGNKNILSVFSDHSGWNQKIITEKHINIWIKLLTGNYKRILANQILQNMKSMLCNGFLVYYCTNYYKLSGAAEYEFTTSWFLSQKSWHSGHTLFQYDKAETWQPLHSRLTIFFQLIGLLMKFIFLWINRD